MMRQKAALPWVLPIMLVVTAGGAASDPRPLSFDYEDGAVGERDVSTHQTEVDEVTGQAYVYAAFEMGPENPIPYGNVQADATRLAPLHQTRTIDLRAYAIMSRTTCPCTFVSRR